MTLYPHYFPAEGDFRARWADVRKADPDAPHRHGLSKEMMEKMGDGGMMNLGGATGRGGGRFGPGGGMMGGMGDNWGGMPGNRNVCTSEHTASLVMHC